MKQDREWDEPQGARANTNSSHTTIQAIRDTSHLAILSATRSFPLQVRNSNSDGAREVQNCFNESLTRSSCFETVNIVIESRLSDDMWVVTFFSDSVNDDDMTFVVGPSFFSFAAGSSVSSMVSPSFDASSYIGLPRCTLVLKSRHNRGLFCTLE